MTHKCPTSIAISLAMAQTGRWFCRVYSRSCHLWLIQILWRHSIIHSEPSRPVCASDWPFNAIKLLRMAAAATAEMASLTHWLLSVILKNVISILFYWLVSSDFVHAHVIRNPTFHWWPNLMQKRCNSIANTQALHLFSIKTSICGHNQSGTKPNLVAQNLATNFGVFFMIYVMFSQICSMWL